MHKSARLHRRLGQKSRWVDFSFALPALLFFCVFTYYPIVDLLRISLTDWRLTRPEANFVGLKNYQWLFFGNGWKDFSSSLGITAIYTLGEVFITVLGGMLLALLFNRMTRLFHIMRVSMVIPRYVVVSSTALVFMWLYNDSYGVFNYVLGLLGLDGVNWLGSRDTALTSLIIFGGWRTVGYAMLIYLSAMHAISPEYLEAASIDGANGLQQLVHIKLPLLGPTTLFLVVTTITSSMKVFQAVDVLTKGGPYKATNVIVYRIYQYAFVDHRLDRAAAAGFIFFVLLMVFTAFTMSWSNRRVSYDA